MGEEAAQIVAEGGRAQPIMKRPPPLMNYNDGIRMNQFFLFQLCKSESDMAAMAAELEKRKIASTLSESEYTIWKTQVQDMQKKLTDAIKNVQDSSLYNTRDILNSGGRNMPYWNWAEGHGEVLFTEFATVGKDLNRAMWFDVNKRKSFYDTQIKELGWTVKFAEADYAVNWTNYHVANLKLNHDINIFNGMAEQFSDDLESFQAAAGIDFRSMDTYMFQRGYTFMQRANDSWDDVYKKVKAGYDFLAIQANDSAVAFEDKHKTKPYTTAQYNSLKIRIDAIMIGVNNLKPYLENAFSNFKTAQGEFIKESAAAEKNFSTNKDQLKNIEIMMGFNGELNKLYADPYDQDGRLWSQPMWVPTFTDDRAVLRVSAHRGVYDPIHMITESLENVGVLSTSQANNIAAFIGDVFYLAGDFVTLFTTEDLAAGGVISTSEETYAENPRATTTLLPVRYL